MEASTYSCVFNANYKKIVSYIAHKSNLFNIGMIYDMKFVIYD